MAERTHIPGSAACGQWETLLTDALDGLLKPEDEATFTAHMAACAACAALYEEACRGREWLEFLSPEPEAPAGLLEKILAHTGPGHGPRAGWVGQAMPVPAGTAGVPAYFPPVWQQPGFWVRMRSNIQPRLLMTAAMAFFSIALTLNMAGVRLANIRLTGVRLADLRPQAVRSYMERQLTMASVPIVRYYDHLRFVYEVESRVRELRREGYDKDEQRKETQPVMPGQTRQNPGKDPGREQGDKGIRERGREHPGSPAMEPAGNEAGGVLESSLTWCLRSSLYRVCTPTAGPSAPAPVAAATRAQDDTIHFSANSRGMGTCFRAILRGPGTAQHRELGKGARYGLRKS
jgi:hypothetical protein